MMLLGLVLSCEEGALSSALQALVQGHRKGNPAVEKHRQRMCSACIVSIFYTDCSIFIHYCDFRVISICEIVSL